MKLAATLIAMACLAFAGCGGVSDSSAEFGPTVDEACTKLSSTLTQLPQKQADEDLPLAEIDKQANAAGEELQDTISSTDVPSDLEDTKQKLLDTFDQADPKDLDEYKVRIANTGKLYEELGADRCSDYGEASVKVLEGASVADAYKGLPLTNLSN